MYIDDIKVINEAIVGKNGEIYFDRSVSILNDVYIEINGMKQKNSVGSSNLNPKVSIFDIFALMSKR